MWSVFVFSSIIRIHFSCVVVYLSLSMTFFSYWASVRSALWILCRRMFSVLSRCVTLTFNSRHSTTARSHFHLTKAFTENRNSDLRRPRRPVSDGPRSDLLNLCSSLHPCRLLRKNRVYLFPFSVATLPQAVQYCFDLSRVLFTLVDTIRRSLISHEHAPKYRCSAWLVCVQFSHFHRGQYQTNLSQTFYLCWFTKKNADAFQWSHYFYFVQHIRSLNLEFRASVYFVLSISFIYSQVR